MLYSCPFNLSKDANRVLWEITGKCNMRCKHCLYYSSNDCGNSSDLLLEEISEIINQIQADGTINEVWLSGGEPLLRKDILEIITMLSKSGMKPSVSTNGYLVTASMAKDLKESGVNYVHLSIDGIDAMKHDEFRQKKGAFEHVICAADYLNENDIIVGATCIITWDNIVDFDNIVNLATKHGIKVLSFYMVEPLGRGQNLQQCLDTKLMIRLSTEYEKACLKYGDTLCLELFRATDSRRDALLECKCYNFFTITNDGKLGGCPWLMKSSHGVKPLPLVGNNFTDARIKIQEVLRQMILERKQKMSCESCECNQECGKGCLAVSNEQLVDPLCEFLRE